MLAFEMRWRGRKLVQPAHDRRKAARAIVVSAVATGVQVLRHELRQIISGRLATQQLCQRGG
jgi:hypothetical protein